MKTLNWNQMSELGLIEKINREILHPLGLAMSRDVETGHSSLIYVSDDGIFEYDPKVKTTIISDADLKNKLALMIESE